MISVSVRHSSQREPTCAKSDSCKHIILCFRCSGALISEKEREQNEKDKYEACRTFAKYPITIMLTIIENVIISMRDITRTFFALVSLPVLFPFFGGSAEESEREREKEKHICMLVVNVIETLPGLCPHIVSNTLAEPVKQAFCVSICTFVPVKQVNSVPLLDRSHLSATAARLK